MFIGLGMNMVRGGAFFSPSSLFAMSEPGAWYDPSDITTLWQTSGGVTPVSAAGQPVGLMLDKSQGLASTTSFANIGTVSTAGAPGTIATYNTSTGVGSAFRLDGTNTSGVKFAVNTTNYIKINIDVTAGSVSGINIRNSITGVILAAIPSALGNYTAYVQTTTNNIFITAAAAGVVNFTVNSMVDVLGNHAAQSISANRPTYQVDGSGRQYLLFDGSLSGMLTSAITPGTNKSQIFSGITKLSDAARGMVAEMGTGASPASIYLSAPPVGITGYEFSSYGTSQAIATDSNDPAPLTSVLTGIGSIPDSQCVLRVSAVQKASDPSTQGTGNYAANPLYIGRRGGTAWPFNGNLYSLIVRFGESLSSDQITSTENWVNGKTGAY